MGVRREDGVEEDPKAVEDRRRADSGGEGRREINMDIGEKPAPKDAASSDVTDEQRQEERLAKVRRREVGNGHGNKEMGESEPEQQKHFSGTGRWPAGQKARGWRRGRDYPRCPQIVFELSFCRPE